MSSKFERAEEAIREVWEDKSKSLEDCLADLETLKKEIQNLIDLTSQDLANQENQED